MVLHAQWSTLTVALHIMHFFSYLTLYSSRPAATVTVQLLNSDTDLDSLFTDLIDHSSLVTICVLTCTFVSSLVSSAIKALHAINIDDLYRTSAVCVHA